MMRAFQFQRAMVELIRFPKKSLDEVLHDNDTSELSDREIEVLKQMAADAHVRKFGEKMRYVRFRDTTTTLRLTRHYLGHAVLENLYCTLFDPFKSSTDFTVAGAEFARFLLSDAKCEAVRNQWPRYMSEVIQYELKKEETIQDVIRLNDPGLPFGSLLAHRAFSILSFAFDCAAVDRAIENDPSSVLGVAERPNILLFMRSLQAPYHRVFEIDADIQGFLETQRDRPWDWTAALPDAFPAMVDVGLCRELSTRH